MQRLRAISRYALNELAISAKPLREMPRVVRKKFRVKPSSFQSAWPAIVSAMVCLVLLVTSLPAQERVRTSATQLPIETFRRSPDAFFYMGPFQEVVSGSISTEYTDNVNLSTDKISDLSFSLGLGVETTWVISHLNQLQFVVGGAVTENFYGNGRQKLTFAIDPTSKIELKFELADFLRVRFYDQFAYEQNPTSDPTATNTANLNSLTNTIGVGVDADLNFAILSLSGDYSYNSQSGTNVQGQNNPTTTGTRETVRFVPALTFRASPTILYGINGAVTRSTSSDAGNVNSLNAGPFINGKLSREFEFDLAAGITLVDTKPSIPTTYYYDLAVRYQITRHWELIFSASHDLIFTTGTNLTEENLFRLGTRMALTRFINFSVSPFINFGDVKTTTVGIGNAGVNQGSYTLFGIEAGLTWKLRKRWSTGLNYSFVRRESGATFGTGTTASNNYIQNSISFSINYKF
jgi:opacity protein-like surface antigen